jgi:multiphosphoryl transfer protein
LPTVVAVVGIVVVSHSARLAEGVVELAREMGGADVRIEAAGGTDDPDAPLGTDATKVMAAIEAADTGDGVLVLMDLGSAVLSAEMALDFLPPDDDRRIVLSDAPLIEGAVSAATAARLGASVDEVASEARGALAPKAAHLGSPGEAEEPEGGDAPPADESAQLGVTNKLGLHARPAARFVQTAASFDADVRVTNLTTGVGPVSARSLNAVATLGARKGHRLRVDATGGGARAAVDALVALANEGFGDRDDDAAPAPSTPPPGAPAEGTIVGIAASPGIAIGPARRLTAPSMEIPDGRASDPEGEWRSLVGAIDVAKNEIEELRRDAARRLGESEAQIFDAHLLLLADDELLAPARTGIVEESRSAARAWRTAIEDIAGRYERLEDEYQAERAADVYDLGNRVLAHILGVPAARSVTGPGILVVKELAPADAAALDPEVTPGIVGAAGGATSHGAILARSLGIPAVVGAGDGVLGIDEGTTLIVDGAAGRVFVNPAADEIDRFTARRDRAHRLAAEQRAAAAAPAQTADGTRIHVYANIGRPEEAGRALQEGAEGIGLLRTEFLFVDRSEAPSEDEQVAVLTHIAEQLGGRPVIVRTLDAGADKPIAYAAQAAESNPFLGVRGIRLSLRHEALFNTQLRAILRAAADHPIKVMFPMITTVAELDAALAAIDRARTDLSNEGTAVPDEIETGIMVEVPAAALTAGAFAKRISFFSVGTNDLAQYTLAAERGNERVAELADALHPAVLRLIAEVVRAAKTHRVWVGVCGEVAGDPLAAVLLTGLGVTELSMAGAAIPAVKDALGNVRLKAAADLAAQALAADSAAAVRRLAEGN